MLERLDYADFPDPVRMTPSTSPNFPFQNMFVPELTKSHSELGLVIQLNFA